MNIIKHGTVSMIDMTFRGECMACGCVFETVICVSYDRLQCMRYHPTDSLKDLKYNPQTNSFTCSCPECGRIHVKLVEKHLCE